jgi:anion-transporting  ArsA/GET3 family ATPase
MLIDEFLGPKILIVSGKGGVGKTTVSAALALVAARQGRKVCVAEVDRKGTLAHLLGGNAPGYEPVELTSGVWGIGIVPEDALREYLDVQYHMRHFAKVFTSTHFVDYVTTAAPGLKDILVLGKIWYLENDRSPGEVRNFDTIILDAPAAGHMLTFLSAPMGLSDAVRSGPIKRQADWLVEMLQDPARSRVHLVTLPEEMPVSETLETISALRDRAGVNAGPVFANGVYPELFGRAEVKTLNELTSKEVATLHTEAQTVNLRLDQEDVDAMIAYAHFLNTRRAIQTRRLRNLRKGIEDPTLELPFLFSAGLALPDIETLADAMEVEVEKL